MTTSSTGHKGYHFYLSETAGDLWKAYARKVGASKSAVCEAVAQELLGGDPAELDEATRAIVDNALARAARDIHADRLDRMGQSPGRPTTFRR